MTGRRRLGIEARLALLTATVLIIGAIALLGIQGYLTQYLLHTGVVSVVHGIYVSGTSEHPTGGDTTSHAVTIVGGEGQIANCPEGTALMLVSGPEGLSSFECVGDDGTMFGSDGATTAGGINLDDFAFEVATRLATDVSRQLETWTVVIFLGFVALAIAVAWLIAHRSLGRVGEIITTTRAIDPADLSGRLRLGGPDDEIRELGDTIDGMLDRIQEGFERQERFVAGASHELRTPLATTRALLEIPLEQGLVPELIEPDIRDALAATVRSQQLVAALLTLARSGHSEVATTTANLAAVAAESVAEWEPAAMAKGQQFAVDLAPAEAAASPELLMLAVRNLIGNAVQHGGGSVDVQTGTNGAIAWLQVTNDGDDLTGVDLEKLKEPFFRGDQSRLAGTGLGLGLALADSAVQACGGELTLTARPVADGGGLSARITLPAEPST